MLPDASSATPDGLLNEGSESIFAMLSKTVLLVSMVELTGLILRLVHAVKKHAVANNKAAKNIFLIGRGFNVLIK